MFAFFKFKDNSQHIIFLAVKGVNTEFTMGKILQATPHQFISTLTSLEALFSS